MTATATHPLAVGQRVRVHLNLHLGTFSVADPKDGKVICNVERITLAGCEFRVGEKMRQRTLATNRRKVMAYVVGTIVNVGQPCPEATEQVTYNPYRSGAFHYSGQVVNEVWQAPLVHFNERYCWVPA